MAVNSNFRLLAWDTSSKAGALVAMEWQTPLLQGTFPQLVTELSLNVDLTHSDRLLWGIHQVLESARWKLEDVDQFGVGVGPGSFTGLRIGVTTARTLAHTLKKPLIGVSSLAALARPLSLQFSAAQGQTQSHPTQTLIIAATDACKGDLFGLWGWADAVGACAICPSSSEPGVWDNRVTEAVLSGEELIHSALSLLRKEEKTQWVVVGEARTRYPKLWESLPPEQQAGVLPPWFDQVQGRYLGLLVFDAIRLGVNQKALQVFPRYLRASEAERKLAAGLLVQKRQGGV